MADKAKLSPGNWISIMALVVTLLVIGGGVSSQIYATKVDVAAVEMCCAKAQEQTRLNKQATTYQVLTLERVQVQIENMDSEQRADSKDIARLLERFRVEPVARVEPKPVPKAASVPDFKPPTP